MPDTTTPGQLAFAAWERAMAAPAPVDPDALWPTLGDTEQRAWEAAAQAAITAWWQAHEAVICGEEEENAHA